MSNSTEIEDKFRIDFQMKPKEYRLGHQLAKANRETAKVFRLNMLSSALIIAGTSYFGYKFYKSRDLNLIKTMMIYNALAFFVGVSVNMTGDNNESQ